MTREELAQAIDAYAEGLEAELSLLRTLLRLSEQQHGADLETITRITDQRSGLMRGLVEVEAQIRPLREQLHRHQQVAAGIDGFQDLVVLHRAAGDIVSTILAADQDTASALRDAEISRRVASRALDAGDTTLAAYRKVVSPAPESASLVNRRG